LDESKVLEDSKVMKGKSAGASSQNSMDVSFGRLTVCAGTLSAKCMPHFAARSLRAAVFGFDELETA
jgi:hypothetical protein